MDGGRAGIAARRDRSHRHADGRPAAAHLAAAAADRARADPRSARCGRRARRRTTDRGKAARDAKSVQDLERLIVAHRAVHRGPARPDRRCRDRWPRLPRLRAAARRMPGAARAAAYSASSTTCPTCAQWIEATIADEPPALARDGGFVRDGFDKEIDELRHISRSGKQVIAEMEEAERARTGISSLKVRFNRVFGYYIEVSKSNLHAVPADYIRKQTIAGGERFITPALKEYEEKVLGADERIVARELELFEALRQRVAAESPRVLDTARALAGSTCWPALAETATACNYTKPHVHDGDEIVATDVRHPVVERLAGGRFVPNDIQLNGSDASARHPDRPEHGRQVDIPAAGRRCSACWRRSGSFVPAREAKMSASSIASTRASARRTTSRAGNRRSWSRCRRPRTS